MIRTLALAAALAVSLCGCVGVPAAMWIAVGSAAVGATGAAISGIHDCKQDGGCKEWPLPP